MYAALLSIIDIVNQLYDWAYGAKYDEFGEVSYFIVYSYSYYSFDFY